MQFDYLKFNDIMRKGQATKNAHKRTQHSAHRIR